MRYELVYSSGGHGGPYADEDAAKAAAEKLLKGGSDRWIALVPYSSKQFRGDKAKADWVLDKSSGWEQGPYNVSNHGLKPWMGETSTVETLRYNKATRKIEMRLKNEAWDEAAMQAATQDCHALSMKLRRSADLRVKTAGEVISYLASNLDRDDNSPKGLWHAVDKFVEAMSGAIHPVESRQESLNEMRVMAGVAPLPMRREAKATAWGPELNPLIAPLPNERSARNKANRLLADLSRKYHQGIPTTELTNILDQAGFDSRPLEGIYTGRDGKSHDQVGPKTWLALSWHKMDSGNYEINAYLS
jgi:hypothetical protein